MSGSLWGDPFLEIHQANLDRQLAAEMDRLERSIPAAYGYNAGLLARHYPTLPADIIAAAGVSGVTADNPAMLDVALQHERMKASERRGLVEKIGGGFFNTVSGIFQGTVRGAFTVFDMIWEEGLARPFKTLMATVGLSDQHGPMNPLTAWHEAGTSYGLRSIGNLLSGKRVNLGSGFLPRSTMAEDTEEYRRLVNSGVPAHEARAIVQEKIGAPITSQARESQEQLTMGGLPISPGRTAAHGAHLISGGLLFEPGTIPFNVLSGALDAAAQIGTMRFMRFPNLARAQRGARLLTTGRGVNIVGPQTETTLSRLAGRRIPIPRIGDPTAQVLKNIGKMRARQRAFDIADEARVASEWFNNIPGASGLVRGLRRTTHGPTVDRWLASRYGRMLVEFLDNYINEDNIEQVVDFFYRKNRHLPREFFSRIARSGAAGSGESAADVIRYYANSSDRLLTTVPTAVGPLARPGGFFGKKLARGAHRFGHPLAPRRTPHLGEAMGRGIGPRAPLPGPALEKPMPSAVMRGRKAFRPDRDPFIDGALGQMGGARVGVRAGMDTYSWGRLFREMPHRSIDIEDADQGFKDLHEFTTSAMFSSKQKSDLLMKWASDVTGVNANKAAYDIATEAFETLAKNLEDAGFPQIIVKNLRENFSSQRRIRIFFGGEASGEVFHPLSRLKILSTGDAIVSPNPQLISEYLQRAIPLPDARELRKAMSDIRRVLNYTEYDGKLKKWWLRDMKKAQGTALELNENALQRSLDWYNQKLWKPMTLLRVAWPVRVIGEETLRIGAAGFDSLINHPIRAISWMITDPDANAFTKVANRLGLKPRGHVLTKYDITDPQVLADLKKLGLSEKDFILQATQEYEQAMTKSGGWLWGLYQNPWAKQAWVDVHKGTALYGASWLHEIVQMHGDDLMRVTASQGREGAYEWLESAVGRKWIREMRDSMHDDVVRARFDDPKALRSMVDFMDARLQMKTGGRAQLHLLDADGNRIMTYAGEDILPKQMVEAVEADEWGRFEYEILEHGNEDLRKLVGTGEWKNKNMLDRLTEHRRDSLIGDLTDKNQGYFDIGPATVKGPIDDGMAKAQGLGWDRAINYLFDHLMSIPTNTLSRGPVFKQVLWRFLEDSIPFMAKNVHQDLLRAAKVANLPRDTIRRLQMKIARAESASGYGVLDETIAARKANFGRFDTMSDEDLIGRIVGSELLEEVHGFRKKVPIAAGPRTFRVRKKEDIEEWFLNRLKNMDDDSITDADLAIYTLWKRHADEGDYFAREVVDRLDEAAKKRLGLDVDEVSQRYQRVLRLRAEDKTWAEIAQELGVSPTTARRWGKEAASKLTPQQRAVALYAEGRSWREIAEELGVSQSTARRWYQAGMKTDGLKELVDDTLEEVWEAIEAKSVHRHMQERFDRYATTEAHAFMNWEDAEVVAKAHALEGTKDLLYDVTKRHQYMDMMRNIFPFGEAWIEVLTAWTRLLVENPQIVRRGQQFIEGAREADPFNTGQGFFFTDPETGEEVFNYPMSGFLFNAAGTKPLDTKMTGAAGAGIGAGLGGAFGGPPGALLGGALGGLVGGIAPGMGITGAMTAPFTGGMLGTGPGDVGVRYQGSVAGLNLFAGSYIPGFGPVVQIAASQLLGDNPSFDYLRKLVTPFGDQRIKSFQDLADLTLPRWLQRMAQAVGIRDPDQERLFGNTVIDVYKILVLTQGPPTAEQEPEYLRKAQGIASKLTMYRSFAHMFAPAAPQIRFEVRDKNGDLWLFQSLAAEYQRILFDEAQGDDTNAFQLFTQRFGLDPTLFAVPKSVQLAKRSVTEAGDRWARENRGLFEAAPLTAYFASPDDPADESFDYSAYVRQLEEDARRGLTPEQWVQRRNDTIGRILYEKARRELDEALGVQPSEIKTRTLRLARDFLIDRYQGYRQPIIGAPQTPSLEQKIRELEHIWPLHAELAQSQAGQAARIYLRARDQLMGAAEHLGLSREGLFKAERTLPHREALRQIAGRLIARYPDFLYLYRLVLEHEFQDDLGSVINLSRIGNVSSTFAGAG